jgi:hypothetical protein
MTAVWRSLLAPGPVPAKGWLLAAHPDADALTAELLRGLAGRRLLLLAKVAHNRCRPSGPTLHAPQSYPRDAGSAWRDLRHGIANMQMRGATA